MTSRSAFNVLSRTNIERLGMVFAFAILTLYFTSCNEPNETSRPSGISPSATLIHAPKGTGVWQDCWLEKQAVYCKIANRDGVEIYNERFAIYFGQTPKEAMDLKISSQGGEQWGPTRERHYLDPNVGRGAHAKVS